MPHDWDRTQTAAEARRWQLLAAGRKAILEHGLDDFTVDDVVRMAGLAKGSFYTYYRTRDEFLDALRLALAEDIGEAVHQAAAGPWAGLFGRMMRAARDWLIKNDALQGLFSPIYMADPERGTREPLVAVIATVLHAGARAGVLVLPEGSDEAAASSAAQMALDLMREASARSVVSHPDEAPIAAAEAFLARAFAIDARAARKATYTPGNP